MRCLQFLPGPPTHALLPPASVGAKPEGCPPLRILACVDHEDGRVMDLAANLAAGLHGTLAVLFVVNDISAASALTSYSNADVVADRRERGRKILSNLAARYPGTTTLLREGSASVQIAAAARDWAANLIVMGTHRRGAFGTFFLGSISSDILQHSTCPVLLVPIPAQHGRQHCVHGSTTGMHDVRLEDHRSSQDAIPNLSSANVRLERSIP